MAKSVHPLCRQLRELRLANGFSLSRIETTFDFPSVVWGAYERGDRVPPLVKLERAYRFFDYELRAIPLGPDAVRLSGDLIADLREIADCLEERHAVLTLP